MKLKELVQNLDAAKPWLPKAVSRILGKNLIRDPEDDDENIVVYTVGPLHYEEGLIIDEVHLRMAMPKEEMVRLIISINDNSNCLRRAEVEECFPGIESRPHAIPRGRSWDEKTSYRMERPWGYISFGYKAKRPDCLSSIVFIPWKWE